MKFIKQQLFTYFLLFNVLSISAQGIFEIEASMMVFDTADFASCHASTITMNSDGDLLAAWFGGPYERHPEVCIYGSFFRNGQWSAPELLADGIMNDTLRYPCWNPVLFTLPNRHIVLFYKVGPSPQTWWGMYKVSKDGGIHWSEAVRLPEPFLGPIKNKPILLGHRLICGSSTESPQDEWITHIESCNMKLKNWKTIEVNNDTFKAIQPTFIQVAKKEIKMLCRTKNRCIAQSYSLNGGEAFTALTNSGYPNNNSGIDAVTLPNGIHLLVCNPISETDYTQGRNKLVLLYSKDGENWQTALNLENESQGEFSYPAIIQGNDNTIHIMYTYNRLKIKYVQIKYK